MNVEKVFVAGNRGPCGGVNMALEAVTQVLDLVADREPVYTNWDIVNNRPVMEELKMRGLVCVNNNWDLIPDHSIVFFSAHGVPPSFHEIAKQRSFFIIDVTCPLVGRVHNLVLRAKENKHIIYIGTKNHPETIGVLGEVDPSNISLVQSEKDIQQLVFPKDKPRVVYSQTTLLPDEVQEIEVKLKQKDPDIEIPNRLDICYAMFNRQAALEQLLPKINLLLVVGSIHSHNSQELRRKGEKFGLPSYSVDYPEQIEPSWLTPQIRIAGLTSGASVLDRFTAAVLEWFKEQNPTIEVIIEPQVIEERSMIFKLPQRDIEALSQRYSQ